MFIFQHSTIVIALFIFMVVKGLRMRRLYGIFLHKQ